MILLDVTHTSHCAANTGIQRVVRRLFREMKACSIPVVHDLYGHYWRNPDTAEMRLLDYASDLGSGKKRSAAWSLRQKWKGRFVSLGYPPFDPVTARADGLLVPEIFAAPRTGAAFGRIRARVDGPAMAIFHDLIPVLMPEHTPAGTVAKFGVYLDGLRRFDAVAAISEFSRDALIRYWEERGESHPPVFAVPLGVDVPAAPYPPGTDTKVPVVLSVGTLEGRKNHLSLLRAAERLWSEGVDFELVLIGGANLETAGEAVGMVAKSIEAGRPLRWLRGASDDAMEREYARASFTVYPSLMEGFGLPILESLARGRPCLCSGENAMAETVRDGGCLAVGNPTPEALAEGIRRLLTDTPLLSRLRSEAGSRKIRSWTEYAADLRALMARLHPAGGPAI